jgi:hypothetical protein
VRGCHDYVHPVVHLVLPLLASGVACAGGISHRLADSLAVSHCGNRSTRRFGVFERPLFSACANVARTASHLTDDPPVCTKVTPPRESKKHRFWPLNGSFLSGLRRPGKPVSLWKPCGNCFLQKNGTRICQKKDLPSRFSFVPNVLNINKLSTLMVPAQGATTS